MNNKRINASIITIGDELLIGQTIDTNSAWMGQELNKAGIWVKRRVAVGDVYDEIWSALDEESKQADIILITGGLGPTADDITKPLLCKYFGGKMVIDEDALKNVQEIFSKYIKRPMLDVNLKQAEVPDVCTVIQNRRGTAPGMWFTKNEKVFVSMPGVPNEMKGMMTDFVLPKLPGMFALPAVVHRTLLTAGLGESYISERLKEFEPSLPEHIKLAYLPNFGMVRLRLTATGNNLSAITSEIDQLFEILQGYVKDVLVINEDKSLEEAIGIMLRKYGKTLATAESCTGGYVAHLITGIAGSSKYFLGGIVSYDNSVKRQVLNVQAETLSKFGAVSEQTVYEMANGVKQVMKTDYSIAI
ncbi:MAG TPA: CinA family nicotinamide mononucleotide deamidase-related protein, partial [Segetibacter sp.]